MDEDKTNDEALYILQSDTGKAAHIDSGKLLDTVKSSNENTADKITQLIRVVKFMLLIQFLAFVEMLLWILRDR